MAIANETELFRRLEDLGEQEVRIRLAKDTFGRHKVKLVQLWLTQKEKENHSLKEAGMTLMNDTVALLKKDGRSFENIRASVQRDKIFTNDPNVPIEEGDVFERSLPNGIVERYLILDAGYYEALGGHYQSLVRKETKIVDPLQATQVVYNLIGPNTRVNIQSSDASTNQVEVRPSELFQILQATAAKAISDQTLLQELQAKVAELEEAQGTDGFITRYKEFMALAGNHMTVFAPFIPALSQMLR